MNIIGPVLPRLSLTTVDVHTYNKILVAHLFVSEVSDYKKKIYVKSLHMKIYLSRFSAKNIF